MIHNLFPIPIGRYKLDRDLSANELSFVLNQDKYSNMGNQTSANKSILKSKELTKLRDFIETKLSEYFAEVHNPKNEINLKMTQSWANYTEKGEFHHKHSHPNSFVSGVFYVSADSAKDSIYFFKDTYEQIKFPPKEWNSWNSSSWWFEVGAGDLILFPSSLTHMVEEVKHEATRVSISFNTFPVGNLGDEIELTGLQLKDLSGTFR